MTLKLLTPPAVEPISLADAKAHLRVDTTDEDSTINLLITVARESIEQETGRALITQSWSWVFDHWPDAFALSVPKPPLITVDAIKSFDSEDAATIVDVNDFILNASSFDGRLVLKVGSSWPIAQRPIAGFEIQFTAGYGAAATDVPAPLRQAILLLVAQSFEERLPFDLAHEGAVLPHAVDVLIAPYRILKL